MFHTSDIASVSPGGEGAGSCPIDHRALSYQKTLPSTEELAGPLIERDEQGVWQVRGFEEARAILRSKDTKQAGFNAEQVEGIQGINNKPILYQEGKVHQQQRKQTARFFTPKTVDSSYRAMIEQFSDRLVAQVVRQQTVDLSRLSMTLAVQVAAQVVGLTNSHLPGMDRRLDAFFTQNTHSSDREPRTKLFKLLNTLIKQRNMPAFYFLDVQPAIQARRRQRREDVISHLLDLKYSDPEILTECVTYGAAGMVTTREFISMAAWHLLEHPALCARYLEAPEEERFALLHEVLRLEPVVGHLYRRATAPLQFESQGEQITIPEGALIHLHLYGANTDEAIVGEEPTLVKPGRPLGGERVPEMLMSFGDGAHRCPGAFLAIQESDIFLQRLLRLPNLRVLRPPTLTWNEVSSGYELRTFLLTTKQS